MTTFTRQAASRLLAQFDPFIRAVQPAAEADDGQGEDVPLVGPDDEGADPETLKEDILAAVREELDWDGTGGDPNASKDALEDALADMFDADVEIRWNGVDTLTLHVEGEPPLRLTADSLGELLEALAKQSGEEDDGDNEPDPADEVADEGADEDEGEQERGYRPSWQRRKNFDESKVNRDPGGEGGGRFVKKGTTAAGAIAGAAKTAGKAGGKPAAGSGAGRKTTTATDLAKRARGRSGPRATAKAVSGALSAATGKRVKVSGNKDGTFNVGSRKEKANGKQVSGLMIASWLGFGVAAGLLGAIGLPVVAGAAATAAQVAIITFLFRKFKNRKRES